MINYYINLAKELSSITRWKQKHAKMFLTLVKMKYKLKLLKGGS